MMGEPNYDFRVSGEQFETTTRNEKTTTFNYKQHRKPYSMIRKEDSSASDSESSSSNDKKSDLKSLLKSAGGGGMSLSEVLQQKNISLADLLNKKQHALAALSANKPPGDSLPSTTTRMDLNSGEMMMTGEDDTEVKKPRRVPMFVAMPPHVYPTEELRPPAPSVNPTLQTLPTIPTDAVVVSQRRIPILDTSGNAKPIKGVASRIRPDFSNSRRPTTSKGNTTTSRPTR